MDCILQYFYKYHPYQGSLDEQKIPDKVFKDSLDSPDCVKILFNCMPNIERKLEVLDFKLEATQQSQIKGKSQLSSLHETVEFLSKKFDDLVKEKDEQIKNLTEKKNKELKKKIEDLEIEQDRQEQYSKRNCLLLHGIEENKKENTDSLVTENIKKYTDMELSDFDIDRSHRLGKPKPNKPRPIIVKFTRYNIRSKIFSSKKTFKGSNISLMESLTQKRVNILNEACNKHGFKNVWKADGKIIYVGDDEKIKKYLK